MPIIKITANNLIISDLYALIGKNIKIEGIISNYRKDEEHYNVVKIYNVEENPTNKYINSVKATANLVGIIIKYVNNIKATQLCLLTNEKYDKHTRLNAVIFDEQRKDDITALSVNSTVGLLGFIQLNKENSKNVNITGCESKTALSGNLELVVSEIWKVKDNEN